jgi:hypothetical protein
MKLASDRLEDILDGSLSKESIIDQFGLTFNINKLPKPPLTTKAHRNIIDMESSATRLPEQVS